MKRILCVLALLLLLISGAFAEHGYEKVYDTAGDPGCLSVRFVWLGDKLEDDKPGDCMILTSPEGKVMVLDTGHPTSTPFVTAALEQMGVEKIDYLVLSHPHIDHIGGAATLMNRYEVGAVYTTELTYNTQTYAACMAAIAKNKVEHIILQEGMTLQFGQNVLIEVLNPPAEIEYPENYPEGSTQFVNNHSLVLKMTYGESSFLFGGDLYVSGERQVFDRWGDKLDVDVAKANHHGASTSTSPNWRKTVSAKITVISNYLLVDFKIARKCDTEGEVYHTYFDGDVLIRTAGDGQYTVTTALEHMNDRYVK